MSLFKWGYDLNKKYRGEVFRKRSYKVQIICALVALGGFLLLFSGIMWSNAVAFVIFLTITAAIFTAFIEPVITRRAIDRANNKLFDEVAESFDEE